VASSRPPVVSVLVRLRALVLVVVASAQITGSPIDSWIHQTRPVRSGALKAADKQVHDKKTRRRRGRRVHLTPDEIGLDSRTGGWTDGRL
jgi:hypothetical protein